MGDMGLTVVLLQQWGPLGLCEGDSVGCGSPNRIQNKSFNALVFPLRGYTTYSIVPVRF
jgi:hypothetical protein